MSLCPGTSPAFCRAFCARWERRKSSNGVKGFRGIGAKKKFFVIGLLRSVLGVRCSLFDVHFVCTVVFTFTTPSHRHTATPIPSFLPPFVSFACFVVKIP